MERQPIKVLLVEDDFDFILMFKVLSANHIKEHFVLEICQTLKQAIEYLGKQPFDAILLDLMLPDSQGLESIRQLRVKHPEIPLIVLTNMDSNELAIQAVQEGAQDYLTKGQLSGDVLMRSLRYALERHKIIAELDTAKKKLEELSMNDPLTGLLNRRGLEQALRREIRVISRGVEIMVIFLDLDDFKLWNDKYGHHIGDKVLCSVSEKLKTLIRSTGYISRIGGDEFIVLLPNTSWEESEHIAERLRKSIRTIRIDGIPDDPKITGSFGLVALSSDSISIEEIQSQAHEALKESKIWGKDKVSVASSSGKKYARDV